MNIGLIRGRTIPNSTGLIQTSQSAVTVGCAMLAGTNKRGILPPDAEGYYTLVVGSYGTHNSAGMFYDEASGVAMFEPSSSLMRRLKKGVLFMEFKHPEPFQDLLIDGRVVRKPMSDAEYLMRIRQIDDNRVCAHIRNLTIVPGINEQGKPVKMVVAEVKPYGPFAQVFNRLTLLIDTRTVQVSILTARFVLLLRTTNTEALSILVKLLLGTSLVKVVSLPQTNTLLRAWKGLLKKNV